MMKILVDSEVLDNFAAEVTKLQVQLQDRFWGRLTQKDGKFLTRVEKKLSEFSNALYAIGHSVKQGEGSDESPRSV